MEKNLICVSKKIIGLILLGAIFILGIILYIKSSESLGYRTKAAETRLGPFCTVKYESGKQILSDSCCRNRPEISCMSGVVLTSSINCRSKTAKICYLGCDQSSGLCKGEKNISSPKTKSISKSDAFKKRIISPTPTPKPTQIISPTPDNNIFQQLMKYEKFMRNNSIADMDNRVLIKQSSQEKNEILSSNLQNQLHSMLSEYFANPQLKDYVFIVNNNEIKYTENWNISGTTGTTYYAYYFINCNPTTNPTICFNPFDNKCLKSSGNCDYSGSLSVIVYKDYKHNNNALYEWSIGGGKIPPDEDKFPWIFGVDKNDKVYTMASGLMSSVMVEETTKLGNNKVFIGYSTRAGYLLIEIYRENNNIVLRGIYLRG